MSMSWLLWREFRLNGWILMCGVGLMLIPFGFTAGAFMELESSHVGLWDLGAMVGMASLTLMQLTLALLGGNAIAGEKADRSAEFLAYLPISRVRMLISKLCLALITAMAIWLVTIGPIVAALGWLGLLTTMTITITGLTFYAVSWLISSFQSSAAIAAVGGAVTPMLIWFAVYRYAVLAELPHLDEFVLTGYVIGCAVTAVVSLGLGSYLYLRSGTNGG